MSKYFDEEILSAYEDLNKEFECKKENVKLHQQIAALEAKLAEKDKTIENWQTMYQSVMQSCHNGIEEDKRLREQLAEKEEQLNNSEQKCLICNKDQENEQLKKQLAEKESEIKSLSSEISSLEQDLTHYKGEVFNLKDQLKEKEKEIERLKYTVDFYKSYYISFKEKVIDELEKVKELCRKDMTICEDYFTIVKILDNQIEELKKEMK